MCVGVGVDSGTSNDNDLRVKGASLEPADGGRAGTPSPAEEARRSKVHESLWADGAIAITSGSGGEIYALAPPGQTLTAAPTTGPEKVVTVAAEHSQADYDRAQKAILNFGESLGSKHRMNADLSAETGEFLVATNAPPRLSNDLVAQFPSMIRIVRAP